MYFSDTLHGGSMIVQVEGNRLDAKWLCGDGVVRDQFTIFKDAGQTREISITRGEELTLSASWVGNYAWSNSATTQTINVNPLVNTTYLVSDPYQCVKDTFNVTVLPVSLNLSLLIEGLYNGNSTMVPKLNMSGESSDPQAVDSITVQLYDPLDLTTPVESASGIVKTNGTVQLTFPIARANPYFIAVRYSNGIETWSKTPVLFKNNTEYDFVH
jgi:hypothetical protein